MLVIYLYRKKNDVVGFVNKSFDFFKLVYLFNRCYIDLVR